MKKLVSVTSLVILIILSSCAAGINCPTYSHSNAKVPVRQSNGGSGGGVFQGGF